jgi:hypothetical protein
MYLTQEQSLSITSSLAPHVMWSKRSTLVVQVLTCATQGYISTLMLQCSKIKVGSATIWSIGPVASDSGIRTSVLFVDYPLDNPYQLIQLTYIVYETQLYIIIFIQRKNRFQKFPDHGKEINKLGL